MFTTTGNLTNVKSNAKFDFGVGMIPGNKRKGSPTGGGNFYIFKKAIAGPAGGRVQVHQVGDAARARGAVEHGNRLRRGVACGLRTPRLRKLRRQLPAPRWWRATSSILGGRVLHP